jgi:hypothetical protein
MANVQKHNNYRNLFAHFIIIMSSYHEKNCDFARPTCVKIGLYVQKWREIMSYCLYCLLLYFS